MCYSQSPGLAPNNFTLKTNTFSESVKQTLFSLVCLAPRGMLRKANEMHKSEFIFKM
jgi:hypothetical protein